MGKATAPCVSVCVWYRLHKIKCFQVGVIAAAHERFSCKLSSLGPFLQQEEPQARQSEEQLTLGMSVPKIIKTMTEKYTKEKSRLKQRQAAMSTFTNFDAAQLERKSNGSEGSASVDASLGTPSASDESFSSQQRVGKRMSAEQASSITQLQVCTTLCSSVLIVRTKNPAD